MMTPPLTRHIKEQVAANNPTIIPMVIITPVRNEEKYLEWTIISILAQTHRPVEWIIVDDGSNDHTPDIVERYAKDYPFIHLVKRQDRGFRQVGGGVVAAFNFGMEYIQHKDYQYIAKLDGDMSFGPDYIGHMLHQFDINPKLACVSGKVYREENGDFIPETHIKKQTAGQFKFYRRAAYEDIGGFVPYVLWDSIDVHTAWMKGWETLSFYDPDAWLWHHRIMGSSDRNLYIGRLRWGRGMWFMGYHPLYAIAACIFRMRDKPFIIGGLLMLYSYFISAIKGVPQYDNPEFRQYTRNWQLQRLKNIILRKDNEK